MKEEYIPEKFWNKAKHPNRKDQPIEKTEKHLNYIKENIKDWEYILDYGCGIGRTFDIYNKTHKIIGADISETYKNRIKERANELDLNFEWIHIRDNKISYKDKYFDSVVCCLVLMHIRPFEISDLMKELARVSKKVIVITKCTDNSKDNENLENKKKYYTKRYKYDYIDICNKNKLFPYNIQYFRDQIMFCYSE